MIFLKDSTSTINSSFLLENFNKSNLSHEIQVYQDFILYSDKKLEKFPNLFYMLFKNLPTYLFFINLENSRDCFNFSRQLPFLPFNV